MVSRRTQAIAGLGVVGVLAGGAFAGRSHYDYNQVCGDTTTNNRVADENCSTTSGYYGLAGPRYGWYSIPTGNSSGYIGGVGTSLNNGSFAVPPQSSSITRGVPSTGSKISRGGFGSSSAKSGSVGG